MTPVSSEQSAQTDYSSAARALLRRARYGILSTFSQQLPGFPFGSVVPCALTPNCEPILCISQLAAHTQNIQADPHVCLTVVEPNTSAETQTDGRFAYMGLVKPVPDTHLEAIRDRFLALVPSARRYIGFGDFRLYTVRFEQGRFVGGFGKISWIYPEPFAVADPIAEAAIAHLAELNQLCREALDRFALGHNRSRAQLANVDSQGLDLRLEDTVWRLEFPADLNANATSVEALAAIVTRQLDANSTA